jgi:hypothetical protein
MFVKDLRGFWLLLFDHIPKLYKCVKGSAAGFQHGRLSHLQVVDSWVDVVSGNERPRFILDLLDQFVVVHIILPSPPRLYPSC